MLAFINYYFVLHVNVRILAFYDGYLGGIEHLF